MIDLSRAISTSMSATSSSSLVVSASARRVPAGSTIWLRPQNSAVRSLPPGSRRGGRCGSRRRVQERAARRSPGPRPASWSAARRCPRRRARAPGSAPGSAGRSRSRSRSGRAACRTRAARHRGRRNRSTPRNGRCVLRYVPIRPSGPDEHGGVAHVVAVALRAARRRRGSRDGRTPLRTPPSTGPGSPPRTAAPPRGSRTRSPGSRTRAARATRRRQRRPPRAAPRQTSRFRSFSPSAGSICATATRTASTLLPFAYAMTKVRFYYDVVCPYSYLESHAVEAAEDAGRRRGRVAPVRASAGTEAAARAARRPPPRRLDAQRLPAGARARDRDPPAALPAALDAAARGLSLGGRARAACAPFKHALYEAFFCEGEDIADDAEIARAAERAGLDPDAAVAAAYSAERFARIREIRAEAEAAGVRGVPTLRTEDGETHWGMGGLERLPRAAARPPHRLSELLAELQDLEAHDPARGRLCASARYRAGLASSAR